MQNLPDVPYPQLFVAYAQKNPKRWQILIGQALTHTKYGTGIIQSANNSYIEVRFVDDQQTLRKFKSDSIANSQFFCDIQLPSNLEEIDQTKERLQVQIYQESQRRLERERQIIAERKQQEEIGSGQPPQHYIHFYRKQRELERQRLEEQRKLEQQKLAEQKEKERIAASEFLNLKIKYNAQSYKMASPSSALYPILLRIDAGEILQDDQIKWLEDNYLFNTLAIYFQDEYRRTNDPWKLVRASAYLRDASDPSKAIELTSELLGIHSIVGSKIKAAILTTRGGAFRDLQDLSAAEQCAKDAIKVNESFQPYNLLGAIYFERGEPEQGEVYFLRALSLGAQSKVQEAQMQNALKKAGQTEQTVVAQFLLKRDPEKYKWAEYYLSQSNPTSSN